MDLAKANTKTYYANKFQKIRLIKNSYIFFKIYLYYSLSIKCELYS